MIQLYLPVKPRFITQKFGETANINYYKENNVPIVGHNGIDFLAYHGQPIYASHSGTCYPEIDAQGGNGVVLFSDDKHYFDNSTSQFVDSTTDTYCNYKTIYWHMIDDTAVVQTGQHVNAGDLLGFADSTGLSTGDHLHFGMKPVAITGETPFTWYNVQQNNGYTGCIDPMPYLLDAYAEDLPTNYEFTQNISIGERSNDVVYLQRKLKQLGFFTYDITGYYGPVTKASVYAFQQKYVALDFMSKAQVLINQGNGVYGLTRAALNKL